MSCQPAPGDRVQQLRLLELEPDYEWRLDEHTRQIGRIGVARAKAVILACRRSGPNPDALVDEPRSA